jgi:hypothetical protein
MIFTTPLQFQPVTLANFAASGAIGTAAATVDLSSTLIVPQTTDGITVSLPSPTAGAAAAVQVLTVVNSGTTVALMVDPGGGGANVAINPGGFTHFMWTGTAWAYPLSAQSGRFSFINPTTSVTLTPLNYMVSCSNGATAITITLPSAALNPGRGYIIKRFAGSTGTVTLSSVSNIQSTAGTLALTTTLAALGTYGQHQQFISDGLNWVRTN